MERKDPNSKSLFMDYLDLTEWHYVMIKFIEDINNIIKKSPVTEKIIYCYRGTTVDYVSIAPNDRKIEYFDVYTKVS